MDCPPGQRKWPFWRGGPTCWIPQGTILSDVRDIRCQVCQHRSSLLFRVGQLWITPGLTTCNIHKLVSLKIRKSAHFFSILGVQSSCSEWQAYSVGASVQKLMEIVPVGIWIDDGKTDWKPNTVEALVSDLTSSEIWKSFLHFSWSLTRVVARRASTVRDFLQNGRVFKISAKRIGA